MDRTSEICLAGAPTLLVGAGAVWITQGDRPWANAHQWVAPAMVLAAIIWPLCVWQRRWLTKIAGSEFWTTDRMAIAWLPIAVFGTAIAICAASWYVYPLPPLSLLNEPSVPTLSDLERPYRNAPRGARLAPKVPVPYIVSLQDLFLTDFNTTLRMHSNLPIVVDGTTEKVIVQAYFDYDSKSDFLGFFVPSTVKDTYKVCMVLAGLDHEGSLKHAGVRTSGGIVGQMTSQNDLVFTGRVYIYHDADLSIEQRASLIQAFRAKSLDVQFRGNDYMLMRDLSRRVEKK